MLRFAHWNADTGAYLGRLLAKGAAVEDLSFSPVFGLLAESASDGARLWGTPNVMMVEDLFGDRRADKLVFNPDGDLLYVFADHKIQLWGVEERCVLKSLDMPPRGYSQSRDVSPDGRWLAFPTKGPDGIAIRIAPGTAAIVARTDFIRARVITI